MTWPNTMADLVKLATLVASVAQGFVYVGLALFLIAFIWWVFSVQGDPNLSVYPAIRFVAILAILAALILAFVPFVRWIRQITG